MSFQTDLNSQSGLVKVTVTLNNGCGKGVHSYSAEAETEELAKSSVLGWLEYQGYQPEDYE